jgi:hypothetical protein
MTPATRRQHQQCRFYLADWCHLHLALTARRIDNPLYVKLV